LEINREKTRVVNLKEKGASLDFLGFTFRYYDDLKGRGWRYLNVSPSAKALKKEREKLKEMTGPNQCFQPIPKLIESLNRQLDGWANYFRFGYSNSIMAVRASSKMETIENYFRRSRLT
jgi:RNA-directed DNA polymerase